MSDQEMAKRVVKRVTAGKAAKQLADELFKLQADFYKAGLDAAAKVTDRAAKTEMQRKVEQASKLLWEVQRDYREKIKNGEVTD